MNRAQKTTTLLALLLALLPAGWAVAGEIAPELAETLAVSAPADDVKVIVQLAAREDLGAYRDRDRRLRRRRLLAALRALAGRTQPAVETRARSLGGRSLKRLWAINAIAMTLPAARVKELAGHPAVLLVRLDSPMQAPRSSPGGTAPAQWNLSAIKAPDLWALGYTGAGVVVGSLDSGVDVQHPDMAAKYRGGTNSWLDLHGQHPTTPHDADGHGTQTMGIMVGGVASAGPAIGAAIGVAPDARWIAARQYNDLGQTNLSLIHLGLQWMLDPDENPATDDAPDVVNASWGFTSADCNTEFTEDIQLLKAAGIAVVFAAGNFGPNEMTGVSPANNSNAFAAGAVDQSNTVALFSSRGPSACDRSVFPAVVAPGVSIETTDLSFGLGALYTNVDGTSFAAPHVVGAMALLAGAFPSATVAQLESALRDGAQDLGESGADNSYGHGLVDVLGAFRLLGGGVNTPPEITSTPITTATQGVAYSYDVNAVDEQGESITFSLVQAPDGMTIDAVTGVIAWTPSARQVGDQLVTVRATDSSGLYSSQSFTIAVANVNDVPEANHDSYRTEPGAALVVPAPGVLGNDSDADGDALKARLLSGPSKGTLSLHPNGGFRYTPAPGFSGPVSFSYRAMDPSGALSNVATVLIDVVASSANRPPLAANDSFRVPRRIGRPYPARLLSVLSNDFDPDSAGSPGNRIDRATVSIVSAPDEGGTAVVITSGPNAGRIAYKPERAFRGIETLSYSVRDTRGAISNTARVRIKVIGKQHGE